MRLTPFNRADLRLAAYRKTKNYSILMEFLNSDMDCARIERAEGDNAYQYANSLRRSIKYFNLNSIKVSVRKDDVFLIRKVD